jgi:hypothetical protein
MASSSQLSSEAVTIESPKKDTWVQVATMSSEYRIDINTETATIEDLFKKVASQIGGSAGPPPSFRLALHGSFKCLGPMTNGIGNWEDKLKDVGVKHATKLFYVPRLRGGIIGGKRRKKSRRMTRRKRGRGRKKTRRKRRKRKRKSRRKR